MMKTVRVMVLAMDVYSCFFCFWWFTEMGVLMVVLTPCVRVDADGEGNGGSCNSNSCSSWVCF